MTAFQEDFLQTVVNVNWASYTVEFTAITGIGFPNVTASCRIIGRTLAFVLPTPTDGVDVIITTPKADLPVVANQASLQWNADTSMRVIFAQTFLIIRARLFKNHVEIFNQLSAPFTDGDGTLEDPLLSQTCHIDFSTNINPIAWTTP